MLIPKTISQNRLASFVLATLATQALILICARLIFSANPFSAAWRDQYSISLPSSQSITSSFSSTISSEANEQAVEEEFTANELSGSVDSFENQEVAEQQAQEMDTLPLVPDEVEAPATAQRTNSITHVVKAGDTLTKIWKSHGASVVGALAASKALSKLEIDIPGLRAGEKIELQISSEKDVISMRRRLKGGKELLLEGSSTAGYTARVSSAEIVSHQRTASGEITSSFSAAALEASVPYEVVDELVDLFSGRLEFRKDIHKGDSFSVIFSESRLQSGELVGVGNIKAASLKVDNHMIVAVRHQSRNGTVRYFDETGEPLGNYYLRYPVQFSRISSVFSGARFHPALRVVRPHNGVDFAAPTGTPVRSVADGIVVASGYAGGAGNMIKIQHDGRYSTAYMHLSKISANVRKGSRVTRGQVIGAVGATGLATGPHLHFSLFDRNSYINPLTAKLPKMPSGAERIAPDYLQATLRSLEAQHALVQMAALTSTAPRA